MTDDSTGQPGYEKAQRSSDRPTDVEDRLDRLESTVKKQQATIEAQRNRIADLASSTDDAGEQGSRSAALNRRTALKAGGLLAALGLGVGAGTASADPQGQVGTASDPLNALYTAELNGPVTGDRAVMNLLGAGLTANGNALGIAGTETDVASTFTESDVTVGNRTNAAVIGGSIVTTQSAEESFISTSTLVNRTAKYGLEIEPSEDLRRLTLEEFPNNSGASTVYLQDGGKNTLETKPAPGGGGTVSFERQLSAGSTYFVAIDNGGSSYDVRSEAVAGTLPKSTSLFDVPAAYNGGDSPKAFGRVRATTGAGSGSATVEFPDVTPVGQWGSVGFDTDQDGETVEMYVQTKSDGGSSWSDWDPDGDGTPEPVAPGTDLSGIPAGSRVRFRVELAQDDLSNRPRLTLLSRQWRP